MSIKAVIFDMDGTLLDTERLYSKCMIKAASEEGWNLDMDTVISCIGTTDAKTGEILCNAMGQEFPYQKIQKAGIGKFREHIENNGLPFKNGAERLLDCLAEKKIPLGLATSTSRNNALEILSYAGMFERFNTVVCGDDVCKSKPNPEIYHKAAENLGIEASEALVFEDSSPGVDSAANAGARVVWVPDIQHIPETTRKRCFDEVGSLHVACDKIGELLA